MLQFIVSVVNRFVKGTLLWYSNTIYMKTKTKDLCNSIIIHHINLYHDKSSMYILQDYVSNLGIIHLLKDHNGMR